MSETQNPFEPSISESTVDEVLATMRDPQEVARDKWPRIADLFRQLVLVVHTEHRLSSMNTRTKLDKTLRPLLRDVSSLRRRIGDDELYWMNKLLSVAALDLYVKSTNPDEPNRYVAPHDILEHTVAQLSDFERLLNHLFDMIEQFDRVDPGEYYTWIGSAGSKREVYIRDEVVPHFRKGGGIGPDTIAVRRIAGIYEYAFDRRFNVNSIDDTLGYLKRRDDRDARGVKANLPRYSGPGIEFSCAVIKALQLDGFFSAYGQDKSTLEKKQREDQHGPPDWKRASALMERQISEVQLINRIGDIWRNDSKRSKKLTPKT
ncbi:hypothetical protein AB7M45_002262 [Bradyrhizobium elkanii]|uniref:hypothetical protein n=1 Tax=Bradyrhizobium elkanii TaxID=29448 RepID=UPI0005724E14|nr:hypothetical protein [Bradyrhizobium elkanii]MCW2189492.1 hypothetical protein [Bradyrhizobium elkanii]NWL74677.1 hypothetical protein [Bradyrhizobium elkanii]OIM95912.1 hypothetical protein BLN97_02855 [Bradyrhizobium elkanii]